MNIEAPIEIKKLSPTLIFAKWADGFESTIKIKKLRDECPAADSREEREKMLDNPLYIPIMKPGRNDLQELSVVGNYAVKPVWGDGHDSGIYTWKIIRDVFTAHKLTATQIEELQKVKANNAAIPQLKLRNN